MHLHGDTETSTQSISMQIAESRGDARAPEQFGPHLITPATTGHAADVPPAAQVQLNLWDTCSSADQNH